MPDRTVDLPDRVAALEQRVTRVEAMTEVVTAIRADVATIAEGVDPTLAGALAAEQELNASQENDLAALKTHVAELAGTVENRGLLLARLLDKEDTK
jgi:hypothetical protein